jgi:hypothetical protein
MRDHSPFQSSRAKNQRVMPHNPAGNAAARKEDLHGPTVLGVLPSEILWPELRDKRERDSDKSILNFKLKIFNFQFKMLYSLRSRASSCRVML